MFLVFHHLQKDKQCKLRHSLCEARWEKTKEFQTQLSSTVTILTDEDCFYYCSDKNNVVVLFGTLKVQFLILTEVSDCGLLIVVTSSTFLKRKDMLKGKRQSAQIIKTCSTAYIYRQIYFVHIYGLHVYCAWVNLNSSGSLGFHSTPGFTSSTRMVCVCSRAYTSTHPSTTLTPAKIEKHTRQNPYLYPCQSVASHTNNKH